MANDSMTRELPMTHARLTRETQLFVPADLSLYRPLPLGALVIPWSLAIVSSVIQESRP